MKCVEDLDYMVSLAKNRAKMCKVYTSIGDPKPKEWMPLRL